MSEGTESSAEGQQEQVSGFKPITSQDQFDAMVKDRIARAVSKFSDYDELKAQAMQRSEASKSLEDKLAEANGRIDELAKAKADSELRALRAEVAQAHGISPEDASLFLHGTDAESLAEQAKRLSERIKPPAGPSVPSEGGSVKPSSPDGDLRDYAGQLFGTTQ